MFHDEKGQFFKSTNNHKFMHLITSKYMKHNKTERRNRESSVIGDFNTTLNY